MHVDTLLALLVGVLIGPAISAGGAFGIQWRHHRRHDEAAARATRPELVSNAAVLDRIRQDGQYRLLSTSTWEITRPALARLLPPGEFVVVSRCYSTIEAMDRRELPVGDHSADAVMTAAEIGYVLCENTFAILERRGWPTKDPQDLTDAIRDDLSAKIAR